MSGNVQAGTVGCERLGRPGGALCIRSPGEYKSRYAQHPVSIKQREIFGYEKIQTRGCLSTSSFKNGKTRIETVDPRIKNG